MKTCERQRLPGHPDDLQLVGAEPDLARAVTKTGEGGALEGVEDARVTRARAFAEKLRGASGSVPTVDPDPRRLPSGSPMESFYCRALRPRVVAPPGQGRPAGSILGDVLAAHPFLEDAALVFAKHGRAQEAQILEFLGALLDPSLDAPERAARLGRCARPFAALLADSLGLDPEALGAGLFAPLFEALAARRSRGQPPGASELEAALSKWLPVRGQNAKDRAKEVLVQDALRELGAALDGFLAEHHADVAEALLALGEELVARTQLGRELQSGEAERVVRALRGLAQDLRDGGQVGSLRLRRAALTALDKTPAEAALLLGRAIFPGGAALLGHLGDENARTLVDLVQVLTQLDHRPEEKRARLASISARLAPAVAALLRHVDANKRPDFFETSFRRYAEVVGPVAARIGGKKGGDAKASGELFARVGETLDKLITRLKDPSNERQLEAHLDVVRFFFRVELDNLVRINPADPAGTRMAIDAILVDIAKLLDIGWNFGRIARAMNGSEMSPELQAEKVRTAIEDMGPFFVKIVQTGVEFMDVAEPEAGTKNLVSALQKLQDQARPLPYAEVEKVFSASTGRRIEDVYVDFEQAPLASGSIGQAHRAKIRVGKALVDVVVKIQKPGVAEAMRHNFHLLRFALKVLGAFATESFEASGAREQLVDQLGKNAEFLKDLGMRDLFEILDGFAENLERSFVREGDFPQEVRNLERFYELFRFHPLIRVPKVYRGLSKGGVITMEYVPATSLRRLLAKDPEKKAHDYEAIKTELIESYIVQTLFFRFLHGDFHGANTGVDDEGKIVLYDLGQMVDLKGRLGAPFGFLIGAFGDNPRRAAKGLRRLCEVASGRAEPDRRRLEADVERILRDSHRLAEGMARSMALAEWIASFDDDLGWRVPQRLQAQLPGFGADQRRDFSDASASFTQGMKAAVGAITTAEAATLSVEALVDRVLEGALLALVEHEKGKALPLDAMRPPLRAALLESALRQRDQIQTALGQETVGEGGARPGFTTRLKRSLDRRVHGARRRAIATAIAAPQLLSMAMSRHDLRLSAEYFQLIKTNISFWMTVLRLDDVKTDLAIGGRVIWREAPLDVFGLLRGLFFREPTQFVLRTLYAPIGAARRLIDRAREPKLSALPNDAGGTVQTWGAALRRWFPRKLRPFGGVLPPTGAIVPAELPEGGVSLHRRTTYCGVVGQSSASLASGSPKSTSPKDD